MNDISKFYHLTSYESLQIAKLTADLNRKRLFSSALLLQMSVDPEVDSQDILNTVDSMIEDGAGGSFSVPITSSNGTIEFLGVNLEDMTVSFMGQDARFEDLDLVLPSGVQVSDIIEELYSGAEINRITSIVYELGLSDQLSPANLMARFQSGGLNIVSQHASDVAGIAMSLASSGVKGTEIVTSIATYLDVSQQLTSTESSISFSQKASKIKTTSWAVILGVAGSISQAFGAILLTISKTAGAVIYALGSVISATTSFVNRSIEQTALFTVNTEAASTCFNTPFYQKVFQNMKNLTSPFAMDGCNNNVLYMLWKYGGCVMKIPGFDIRYWIGGDKPLFPDDYVLPSSNANFDTVRSAMNDDVPLYMEIVPSFSCGISYQKLRPWIVSNDDALRDCIKVSSSVNVTETCFNFRFSDGLSTLLKDLVEQRPFEELDPITFTGKGNIDVSFESPFQKWLRAASVGALVMLDLSRAARSLTETDFQMSIAWKTKIDSNIYDLPETIGLCNWNGSSANYTEFTDCSFARAILSCASWFYYSIFQTGYSLPTSVAVLAKVFLGYDTPFDNDAANAVWINPTGTGTNFNSLMVFLFSIAGSSIPYAGEEYRFKFTSLDTTSMVSLCYPMTCTLSYAIALPLVSMEALRQAAVISTAVAVISTMAVAVTSVVVSLKVKNYLNKKQLQFDAKKAAWLRNPTEEGMNALLADQKKLNRTISLLSSSGGPSSGFTSPGSVNKTIESVLQPAENASNVGSDGLIGYNVQSLTLSDIAKFITGINF